MRIEKLDLRKYRALEGVVLPFRPGARLHLVHGANEAGKTTVLHAVADALFGFDRRHGVVHDMRHETKDLRVGAHLTAADGSKLAFLRAKGNKGTLRDLDDEPVPDHLLAPYLGDVTRETFERRHGLSSQRLREGGAEMLEAQGDAGTTLFAAASGLVGLSKLGDELTEDADGIFAAHKSKKRRFYVALDAHETARRAENEHRLLPTALKQARRAMAETEERIEALRQRRVELNRDLARHDLVAKLHPVRREMEALSTELEAFEDMGQVPPGAVTELERLARDRQDAFEAQGRADEDLQAATTRLADIAVAADLLAEAPAVERLRERAGEIEKALTDRPRVAGRVTEHERALADLATQLGLADVDAMLAARPDAPTLAHLEELTETGREAERRRRDLAERIEEAEAELVKGTSEAPPDPAPLRRRLDALGPDLAKVADLGAMRERHAAAERALRERLSSLDPVPPETFDVPDGATLDAACEALDRARFRRDELAGQLASDRMALEEREATLAREAAAPDFVDAAVIKAARAARDDFLEKGGDAAARRALVARADELADLALVGAERMAAHEGERRTVEKQRRDIARRTEALATHDAAVATAHDAVADLLPFDIGERSTRALRRWREAAAALVEERREMERLADAVATGEREEERLAAPLSALAVTLGVEAGLPPAALARLLDEALDRARDAFEEHARAEAGRTTRADALATLKGKAERAERERAAWRADFAAAAKGAGLTADASLAAARAAVALWARLPDLLAQRDEAATRVAGMTRDIEAFEKGVANLVVRLSPDLERHAPTAAIRALAEACGEARDAEARRVTVTAEVERATASRDNAVSRADTAAARLDERMAELESAAEGDFAAMLERLAERDRLHETLRERRDLFQRLAAGHDAEEIEDALATFDPAEADVAREAIEREMRACEDEGQELHAELDREHRRIEEHGAAGNVERHAFERAGAMADMRQAARDWLVRRAAIHMMRRAVETQAAERSGPLLARAGALFAGLTCGRFSHVEQDLSQVSNPRIVARRPNGETVPVEGLSEGSRDQLYLALRLATLEAHARDAEPMPFIGDDLFHTFDDERTRAGIEVMAAVEGVQPILFTHHRAVVDAAKAALGDGLDLIELSGRGQSVEAREAVSAMP